jgi:hypothetical protein
MKKIILNSIGVIFLTFMAFNLDAQPLPFEVEIVTSDFVPHFDMIVDSNGVVHIAYNSNDGVNYELFYVNRISGAWSTPEFISTTSDTGSTTVSMDVDLLENIHIAFDSGIGSNDTFTYTQNISGNWSTEVVRPTSRWYSLALDSSNNPHVAYYFDYNGLNYAVRTVAGWTHENVDSSGDLGTFAGRIPNLVLDSYDNAHITYFDYISQSIKYATNSSGVWEIENVITGVIGNHGIVIDPEDNIYIAYTDDGDIYLGKRTDDGWVKEVVTDGGYDRNVSIAVDDFGNPYILFINCNAKTLYLSKKEANTWNQYPVYTASSDNILWGLPVRIAQGNLHIALSETPVNSKLVYLRSPLTSSPLTVPIDIKPSTSSNSINPNKKGFIPVAILSTPLLNAVNIDSLSVKFGPKLATHPPEKTNLKDVNEDGLLDLILHFKIQRTGIKCGQTSASLIGKTYTGEDITGSDAIRTVGCE